jgi:hypothetical protein
MSLLPRYSSFYLFSLISCVSPHCSQNGSLLLGNFFSFNEKHRLSSASTSSPSCQQFLEFIHSFLSSALDLSRPITISLSSHNDQSHGVEISPSWRISSSSHNELLSFTNPYPVSHSLSISCSSTLYLSLTNLPDFTSPASAFASSSLYPLYTPLNAAHHYHKHHMRRYNHRYGYTQRSKRRAHFYHKTPLSTSDSALLSRLGDLTSTPPSQGGAPLLNEGDLVAVYGNDTDSHILQLSSSASSSISASGEENGKQFGFKIEGINSGISFVNFYLVCNAHSSTSSHFTPDDQPLDFFPPLLRSHLQSPQQRQQYLSHLFSLSVHVKEYEVPSSASAVGTNELITITEMALTSSLNEEIASKEILLCSQFLLTQVTPHTPFLSVASEGLQAASLDPKDYSKQWKDLHLLLFDENSTIPPPLSEQQKDALLRSRQDRLDTLLEAPPLDPGYGAAAERRKGHSRGGETKAWKLGYL